MREISFSRLCRIWRQVSSQSSCINRFLASDAIVTRADFVHPVLKSDTTTLYRRLKQQQHQWVAPVAMLPVRKQQPWLLGSKTYVMGIVNVTPDSFSDGADLATVDAAVAKALEMERNGVDIIDIGGESSRPGAASVTPEEELARVLPVIKRIRQQSQIPISIDTTKTLVALEAIKAGANIVNDISAGLKDSEMLSTVAKLRVPVGESVHLDGYHET